MLSYLVAISLGLFQGNQIRIQTLVNVIDISAFVYTVIYLNRDLSIALYLDFG